MNLLLILVIILIVVALGGGYGLHSGYYAGNPAYGYGTGLIGIVLVVFVVLLVLGRL